MTKLVEEFIVVLDERVNVCSLSQLHMQEFKETVIKHYGQDIFNEELYNKWWHRASS